MSHCRALRERFTFRMIIRRDRRSMPVRIASPVRCAAMTAAIFAAAMKCTPPVMPAGNKAVSGAALLKQRNLPGLNPIQFSARQTVPHRFCIILLSVVFLCRGFTGYRCPAQAGDALVQRRVGGKKMRYAFAG